MYIYFKSKEGKGYHLIRVKEKELKHVLLVNNENMHLNFTYSILCDCR